MKAALYTRVSTQEQVIDGYSLGAQSDRLQQYAIAMNYEIVGLYTDEGMSGASMARPALQRMLEDIRQHKIDIVIIYKLDRLSRKVKDVLEIVDILAQYNVTLYSLNENIDLSSAFGRAALKMSATFSELERDTITERMTMGRLARVKEGKYITPGKPPFGYYYDKSMRALRPNLQELAAVVKIFDLYLEGYSFRQIFYVCKELYPDIPSFAGNNVLCVKQVIRRPLYAGYFLYRGELYKCTNVSPVISYDIWMKANAIREHKRKNNIHMESPYLLTGLIVCGQCGSNYVAKRYNHASGDKNYSYIKYGCAARVKYDRITYGHKCENKIFSQQFLENYVEKKIKNLRFSDFVKASPDTLMTTLVEENAEIKKTKEKLLDLYLDDKISKQQFISRTDELEEKIRNNEIVIQNEAKQPATPNQAVEFLQDRIKNWDTISIPEKRRVLQLMIDRITVNGDEIVTTWRVK